MGAHKNTNARIRVSVPLMIISLEKGEYIGEMLNLVVLLPRVCGMHVQEIRADEAGDNLS
jgi:hypothetical protein